MTFLLDCRIGQGVRRVQIWLPTLLLAGLLTGCTSSKHGARPATRFGWETGYPGMASGRSDILRQDEQISIRNAALNMTWRRAKAGLRLESVRDVSLDRSLRLTGELFQIVLTNGRRYVASALVPEGRLRFKTLRPQVRATRLAQRSAGRQIEWPLRSADGQLRVVWRAVFRDQANYVRQEIAVTPVATSCGIQEVVWLDENLPQAHPAGSVDGVPAVVDSFFFGIEDPHARNRRPVHQQVIGAWTPDDLALGQRRIKSWTVPANQFVPGTNEIVFRYQRGPHRLDVWRVALLENGREVARDDHHGRAGSELVHNVFALHVAHIQPDARYELIAELGTDPALQLPAGRRVESFGQVVWRYTETRFSCRVRPETVLHPGETLAVSFVWGVAPPGQMRRAFLYYLERERAHPYRPFLHYNSWYDIAWAPFALNETNCLEAIRLLGERFIKPHGVVMDSLVFDDGWDDPQTLWQFHAGFPHGFTPLAKLARKYGTRLGVWLSPFGGYGKPRRQRLKFGRAQGYEINPTGFSLAGPKYYAAFKRACVNMIRRYGVNHFKFDGIATGNYASGSADYLRDTEAMRRLMLELRQEEPDVYINLTTGSWPSPFWLRFADSLWRHGGDMGFTGKGPKQQQWLTYRDREVYRNIVRKSPLYPLNALMTQGVAYSRHGPAGDPSFNSAGFKDDVRAFFGSGTSLQELYIQPGKLTVADWAVLAEAAKWARANADVLVDTHWIGGDPGQLEVYGYASWSPRKGIVMLRNPDDQPHDFDLDVGKAFELPPDAPTEFKLKSPWAEDAGRPAVKGRAGQPLILRLEPFEVLVLEAMPAARDGS